MRPLAIGVTVLLVLSITLSRWPVPYLICLGLAVVATPVGTVVATFAGAKAVRAIRS